MHRATMLLLLAPVALTGGCMRSIGNAGPATSPRLTSANGTFAAYTPGATAVTYDPELVPAGATATVTITQTSSDSRVRLTVAGLQPNRGYGAHLHIDPCGATGAAAGPHYQHRHAPSPAPAPSPSASQPSGDPSYANAQNEVWLDVTTNVDGRASAVATHPWTFDTAPRSLVIHATTTSTAPGEAGNAGARVACLTLPA
jgi:Cu-Zn family superoxide dismutase